jgi:hypothetical protein
MQRGGKFIGSVAMLSLSACGEQGKLEIRPIKAPLAAGIKAVPFRIAEARGQLALGNVALALEAFRMALREDASSIEAMAGVAACYDRMARFDLSRRHYEAALAISPGNLELLTAFAGSLDLQGRTAEAVSVRQEVKQRIALAASDAAPPPPAAVMMAAPKPVTSMPAAPVVLASRIPLPQHKAPAERPAPAPAAAAALLKPIAIAQAARIASPVPIVAPAIGRSVTVILPPARPAKVMPSASAKMAREVSVAQAPMTPVHAAPPMEPAAETRLAKARSLPDRQSPAVKPPVQPDVESAMILARAELDVAQVTGQMKTGPRLERLSLREIELITVRGPQWRALTVNRTQRSATVRFIPLQQFAMRPAGVRVLNAARTDRLAARTRVYLADRGWRAISIGDAPAVRMRSIILYPADRRRIAERLSAQFGFAIAQRPGARQVTILLGRDAARNAALRART